MIAAHTPGPWFLFGNGHCVGGPASDAGTPTAGVAMCGMARRGADESAANAQLIAAAPDLLAACVNARDMLATDRQAFIDCNRVQDSRTEDAVAHGLVWVDEDTWIEPEDAKPLRDYDRAIALIDAAMAKAAGGAT